MFDYGPETKDKTLPPLVDVGVKMKLTRPLMFYGKSYDTVHVGIRSPKSDKFVHFLNVILTFRY